MPKFSEIYESLIKEEFEIVMETLNESQFAVGSDMQELYKLRAQLSQPTANRTEVLEKIEKILEKMPDQAAAAKIRASLNRGITYMGIAKPEPQ